MSSASFGAWVRKQREDKGWSQRQFAALSGLTNAAVSRVESNCHETHTITTMEKIAYALGVPLAVVVQAAGHNLGLPEYELAVANSPIVQLPIIRRVSPLITPLVQEVNVMGHAAVDRSHLSGRPGRYFLVRVADDSMVGANMVPQLSLVLVRQCSRAAEGEIALVSVGSEDAAFRFVAFTGDRVVLTAANPVVRPRIVPRTTAHILGVAIEVMTYTRITKNTNGE